MIEREQIDTWRNYRKYPIEKSPIPVLVENLLVKNVETAEIILSGMGVYRKLFLIKPSPLFHEEGP